MGAKVAALTRIADAVAARTGGTARLIDDGEFPSVAVAVGGRHVVLLRGHVYEVGISLPLERCCSLPSGADWGAITPAAVARVVPEIASAVERERAHDPPAYTMADVILALEGSFGRSSRPKAHVRFPGVPVPMEASIVRGEACVHLTKQKKGVSVVISHVEFEEFVCDANTPSGLARLPAWVDGALARQEQARAAAKAEEEARKKLPLPSPEAVFAAMRAGKRFRVGGGRWYESYFMRDGALVVEQFDEGVSSEAPTTEEAVREAIARHGIDFRADD